MAYPSIRSSIPADTEINSGNISCTHPTGLTVGDLMVLFVSTFDPSGDGSITTPSGWTLQTKAEATNDYVFAAYKKTAVSGDVSAGSTTVTFTAGTVDKSGYGMFAITGAAVGNEITVSEADDIASSSAVTTLNVTTALTPVVPETLVLSAFQIVDFDLSAVLTASAFTLTPTSTMTERVDVGDRDVRSDGFSLFIASAEYAGTTEITSRSVTFSESVDPGASLSIILFVNATVDATGTNALLQVSPTQFSQAGVAGTTGTNTLHSVSPTMFAQSGNGQRGTPWTNPNKPATNWNNLPK